MTEIFWYKSLMYEKDTTINYSIQYEHFIFERTSQSD